MAISTFLTCFFLCGFQLRQALAVVMRMVHKLYTATASHSESGLVGISSREAGWFTEGVFCLAGFSKE